MQVHNYAPGSPAAECAVSYSQEDVQACVGGGVSSDTGPSCSAWTVKNGWTVAN